MIVNDVALLKLVYYLGLISGLLSATFGWLVNELIQKDKKVKK